MEKTQIPIVEAVAVPATNNVVNAGAVSNQLNGVGSPIDEISTRDFLFRHDWPLGLVHTFIENAQKVGFRYFIVDDSGSMINQDGRLPYSGNVAVTRWEELRESMSWHVDAILASKLPSEIRFLNAAPPIRIGGDYDHEGIGIATINGVLSEGPRGMTPLCTHVREVIADIRLHERELRANRQVAVLMIATDGHPSDGDLVTAMRPLEQLPVWVVIKLCTDDDNIVQYWNDIDSKLEVEMDVIDDFYSEAAEVAENNRFVTYGLPLHRMREFGLVKKEFDLLDEAKLTHAQMRTIVQSILGGDYPNALDWKDFYQAVQAANATNSRVKDPNRQDRAHRWIQEKALWREYSPPGNGCVIS